jgi:asparagine synthase (glutamine-hydrolysing)
MAHTIETRVPFLDRSVIEFSRKLPVDCKLNGKPYENKRILREAFIKIVGKQISERPKNPMDEGAIHGGKRPLNDLFNSLVEEINIPANYQKSFNLNIESFKEETYYLNTFLELGFDNELSKKRIKVRKH